MSDTVAAFLINRTIYDTDISRVTYEPANEACAQWAAESLVSQTEADRVAIWLYGPPRTKFLHPIPDYKVCVHDDDKFGSTSSCYRVNVNASLSDSVDDSVPTVFFALGNLWPGKHHVVVSMAEPRDDTQTHNGILFSHAIYSVIRPTPWPVQEDPWRFREVAMHATHPALSYSPSIDPTTCSDSECGLRYYRAENGKMESWHSLELRDGLAHSGVTAKFTAGTVAIYGAPWTQIVAPMHIGNACVRINSGPCEVIDAFHAYLSSNHDHESVVLWRYEGLNPSLETELSIQLMSTESQDAVFPFKEIRYLEEREYASPQQPVGQSEEVHVAHDDWAVVYHPGRRCVRHFGRSCTKWWDPWVWREAGPSGSVLTYRSTTAVYRTTEDPYIKLEFRGSEVRVYGAPKSLVKLPLAPQQICLNNICQLVDTEQAYLNTLPENTLPTSEAHPELDLVLLWSMVGLDDQIEHTLRLALAPFPSADEAEMTIAKIVYTKVSYEPGQSRPETPAPAADSAHAGPSRPPHSNDWTDPPRDSPLPPSSSPLPSPSPPPIPAPPHSSDLPAPPHNPPPPSLPTPRGPPANIIIDRILPSFILVIGLCILGSRIYSAMYPRRTRRALARSVGQNAA